MKNGEKFVWLVLLATMIMLGVIIGVVGFTVS